MTLRLSTMKSMERQSKLLLSCRDLGLQQELDRTPQHANEALKAIDTERQQLRSANTRLRDTIKELRRSLEPKENAIETLQQSLLEKDEMLDNIRGQLQAATSLAEHSSAHQQQIANLEAKLAYSSADRMKATETISSLQIEKLNEVMTENNRGIL